MKNNLKKKKTYKELACWISASSIWRESW